MAKRRNGWSRRSATVAGLAAFSVAALTGALIGGASALSPGGVARGRAAASSFVERLKGHAEPQSVPAPSQPAVTQKDAVNDGELGPASGQVRQASGQVRQEESAPAAVDPPRPVSDVPDGMTLVSWPERATGHRVFVDGRSVGNAGSAPMLVSCGSHRVQIGSRGKPYVVSLPCGERFTIR